jgi:hypothetical protein
MSQDAERQKYLEHTKKSLERIQGFDVSTLPRVDVLGTALNFSDAVEPAMRLIDLYRQLPVDVLEQLPNSSLRTIQTQADNDFNLLDAIMKFEPGMPKTERDNRIVHVTQAYDPTFQQLHPFISYAVRKSTDFSKLEREARSLIQNVTDRAHELQQDLEKRRKEADAVLHAVRKVAEEQGVSQQAIYFKSEADNHEKESGIWLNRTVFLTVGLTAYAAATLFLHKIPILVPTTIYETVQLAASKVLIFVTISYFLILSAKNYVAHRHNSVVNRHRQNALATYTALVKAAGEEATRDVVLAKAADCIFSAQATGFAKTESSESGSLSLVNVAPGGVRPTISG